MVEVHHERLREGQGQEEGRKTTASAGYNYALVVMTFATYNATSCLVAQYRIG